MNTGNLNGQGLAELQNYKFQNLAAAPTTNLAGGRYYYSTADNTLYVYNGSQWLNALAQGTTYTFSTGLTETSGTVTLNIASTVALGGVIVGSNISVDANGTISVANASTSAKGVIEIATDSEASTGTDTTRAVTPKQLATKIGLTDLSSTATGLTYTNTTGVFSLTSGYVIPTTTDFNAKITLSSLSIDSGSTNYLGYDNSTGKISAKVDTTVTQSSSKLVTSGAVYTAINNAVTGGMVYKGVWTATGQTDYSSITLPVKAGYMYLVSGSATIGGIEWNTDDYLVINADVAVGGTITDVKKIDNTEGSDIVRLNASQTLTNKTIDADNNTISDLTTSNLKSGVLQTTVRAVASASDTAIPSEKAVASALAGRVYSAQNTALTVSGGICTWTVTHNLGTKDVGVFIYDASTGDKVLYDYATTSTSVVTVKILSSSNIAANTYRIVVLA